MTAGPITEQARELVKLVFSKNDIFFTRWRSVQLHELPAWAKNPESEAGRAAEIARLDQQVADQEAKINEVRRPKPHQLVVKPATD